MVIEKKSLEENEIDLAEAISVIWKNKLKILFFTFLPAALYFLYLSTQDPVKTIFKSTTEIIPISILDELEYKNFNSYLNNYQNYLANLNENISNLKEGAYVYNNSVNEDIESLFTRIDRIYLMNLYIEKLSEDKFIINSIKKFGLIKNNFESTDKYEEAVLKAALLFELSPISIKDKNIFPKWNIQFTTDDKEKYENFLKFLDRSVNLEIQNYLKNNFNDSITNEKIFQKYMIEDINIDIGIRSSNLTKDDSSIQKLKIYKQNILENKSIDRLEESFNLTPVIKSKEFIASRINVKSTTYKILNKRKLNSPITKVLTVAILGAILGIFYVLIFQRAKKL